MAPSPPPTSSPSPRTHPTDPVSNDPAHPSDPHSSGAAPPAVGAVGPTAGASRREKKTFVPAFKLSTEEDDTGLRRPSVQFMPQDDGGAPTVRNKPPSVRRRMSSPPPPPLFEPRVSFDTFERVGELTSFSLIKKHKDYAYTKLSRTFLCGIDSNDYSEYALEWLIDELVDDGDEVVCLRVLEKDSDLATPVSVKQKQYREEAEQLMAKIQHKNAENKAINLILEFAAGKVQDVIGDMIKLYEPAILIVGTRGRSLGGIQGLLPGSISKYCLQHSPVPVIVVRPNSKRAKNKQKRLHDPSRQSYRDLVYKSGDGSYTGASRDPSLAPQSSTDISAPAAGSENEPPAVAEAKGPVERESSRTSPLANMESVEPEATDTINPESETNPEESRRLMTSPVMEDAKRMASSDSEFQEEEGPVAKMAKRLAATSTSD